MGFVCLSLILALFANNGIVFAADEEKEENTNLPLTRGAAVYRIIDSFELNRTRKTYLQECRQRPDECFFVFAAMSDYDDISFSPLNLYPDVFQKYRYYDAINTASMLGLIHGYLDENKTPFRPELAMTRIQALKVVLGASDRMDWKDQFELTEEESGQRSVYMDNALSSEDNWWYHRYLIYAYDNNIVSEKDFFRPDEPVIVAELIEMMDNAKTQ